MSCPTVANLCTLRGQQLKTKLMQMSTPATVVRSVRASNGAGGHTQTRDEVETDLYYQVGAPRNQMLVVGGAVQSVQTIPVELVDPARAVDALDVLPGDCIEVTLTEKVHRYEVIGTDRGTADTTVLTCTCKRWVR